MERDFLMTPYRGSHFERKEIIFAVKTNNFLITNQFMLVFTPRHNEPNEQLTEEILSGSIWETISFLVLTFSVLWQDLYGRRKMSCFDK